MTSEAAYEFRLLGPVEVRDGPAPLALGGRLQRALLADLVLNVGRTVPTTRLIDDLWGEAPPASANHTVETYVSRLRRILRLGSIGDVLITRAPGYVLDVDPDRVDLVRFGRLVAQADTAETLGDFEQVSAVLGGADSLWRGAALSDIADVPFVAAAARRLEAERLVAIERRVEADLRVGRHRDVVADLEALTAQHPYREAFARLLMVALYRSGRQADALAVFRAARATLSDELGVDPGPDLTELEQAILRHDTSLAAPQTPSTSATGRPVMAAGSTDRSTTPGRRRRRLWVAGGVVAIAVIATATALATHRQPPAGEAPTNGVAELAASGQSVAAGLKIPTAPGDLTLGGGSIWMSSPEGQVVYRIDPTSRHVLQTISVGAGPQGVAFADGVVWVANALDGTVSRIDAATNRVVQVIGAGAQPTRVAYGYGSVWVTDPLASAVTRINPQTGRLIATIPVPQPPVGIALGAGSAWVTSSSDDTVTQIDPLTGAVHARIPVGGGPDSVAFGFGGVWVANSLDSTVSRIDPARAAVDNTITVGEGPDGLAVGPTSIWVTDGLAGSVSQIDPRTGAVTSTAAVGNMPGAALFAGGRLWVAVRPRAASAHRGGTLHLVSAAPFASVDPAVGYPAVPPLFYASIFDTLVTFERVGGSAGLRLVPDLAVAVPLPEDSGTTYSFTVRPGLRYSTGAAVRAEDFRHGLERVFEMNPAARSFFADLAGASACSLGLPCNLSRGIVVDDAARTVTFHLTHFDADFLDKLAFFFAAPVPVDIPPVDIGTNPVPSTGPYMIKRFVPGHEIDLVRNSRFREWSPAAQPDGYAAAMRWTFGDSRAADIRSVERGSADWSVDAPPDVAAVEAQFTRQVHVNPLPGVAYAAFNVTVPPFNDVRVRRAVSFAADRESAVTALGGPQAAAPTCQIVPPDLPGYRSYCPFTVDPGHGWVGPDLARAHRLIAASHTAGMSVTVWGHHGDDALGAYFVSLLNKLGYHARLHLADDAQVAAAVNDSRRRAQASIGEWITDYPSASDLFDLFFRCSAFTPADPQDTRSSLFYCRPKIDQLMDRADVAQTTDPSRAAALWAQVDHAVTSDAPWVPFVSLRFADVVSARAGNYQYNPVWGLLLDQLWVR